MNEVIFRRNDNRWDKIYFEPLPLGAIKKDKLFKGVSPYEVTLTELLNASPYFKNKVNRSHFEEVKMQSNGEADAVAQWHNGKYELDFKMLISSDIMALRSNEEPEINTSLLGQGFLVVNTKKEKLTPYAEEILENIRNISDEDLENIKNNIKTNDKTLRDFAKNIMKDKNLCIFFPYKIKSILFSSFQEYINKVFPKIMNIRKHIDKETYFCYFQKDVFVIMLYKENEFHIIDKVPSILLPNFRDFMMYSNV